MADPGKPARYTESLKALASVLVSAAQLLPGVELLDKGIRRKLAEAVDAARQTRPPPKVKLAA